MSILAVHHGIATALRRTGRYDGVPVLAVHGFAADMSVWMLAEPALHADCALTLLDLPCHGASATTLPEGGFEGFAAHLADVLGTLARPHWLLTHSFGAAVALGAASLLPARVAGLIMVAPAGLGARIAPDFPPALCDAPDTSAMRITLGRMVARPEMITPAMARGVLAQMMDPARQDALRKVAALLPDLDDKLAPSLPALANLPIHVLHGAQDAIIAPDVPLPVCWQDARKHLIPAAGHLPQLEAATATMQHIRAALGLA